MSIDTIEKAIVSLLKNDATVAGLVSARIYPMIVPQDTALPAISFQQASGERVHTMDGADNLVPSAYEITCVDDSYGTCRTLADAVRGALDSYAGTNGSVTTPAIFMTGERDSLYQSATMKRYSKTLTFDVYFNE